jgi:hypothetical protein
VHDAQDIDALALRIKARNYPLTHEPAMNRSAAEACHSTIRTVFI